VPWTDDARTNFGFSEPAPDGSVAAAWLPQPEGWGSRAASLQRHDESSMLALYRAALACRRSFAEAMGDDFDWAEGFGDDVVAFTRGSVLVVLNLGGRPQPLPADAVGERRVALSSLHGHHDASVIPADAALWLAA
jgi:alpha-glucosidase